MQHEERREGREGNSLLGRPVLCQVVVENKADWTFAPLSGYRILCWHRQPYLRIDGRVGGTLTRRSPAIWRCRRIDLGEVLVQVPPARGAGVDRC